MYIARHGKVTYSQCCNLNVRLSVHCTLHEGGGGSANLAAVVLEHERCRSVADEKGGFRRRASFARRQIAWPRLSRTKRWRAAGEAASQILKISRKFASVNQDLRSEN